MLLTALMIFGLPVAILAQCCSNGANLLSTYNPDFSATYTTSPPGFQTDNTYSTTPGAGTYTIITSRNYGACGASPEYDHTTGGAPGKYLWFDTPGSASPSNPAIAWRPYDPARPVGQRNLLDVTPNTDYVFSVWIRDLARNTDCVSGGAPIMGLRINGVDMAQINLGQYTSSCCPQWVYLCAPWNSGSATTVDIRIESRTGSGFTDLGIDDVYFGTTTAPNVAGALGNDTTICAGQSLSLNPNIAGATYVWSDGSTGNILTVSSPGTYWVDATIGGCTGRDSIVVGQAIPPTVALRSDTTLCDTDYILIPTVTGTPPFTYLWQFGTSTDTFFHVTITSRYWVTVSNQCGSATDTVNMTLRISPPAFTLGNDTTICAGSYTVLRPQPVTAYTYLWQDGTTAHTDTARTPGLYWLDVSNSCGSKRDSVVITQAQPPTVALRSDTTICDNGYLLIPTVTGTPPLNYVWQFGLSTDTSYYVNDTGSYWVTVSNQCGSASDTVNMTLRPLPPTFTLGNDTTICAGDYVVLRPNIMPSYTYQWQDGTIAHTDTARTPGLYWLDISNQCGSKRDSVVVSLLNPPSAFTLGNDTSLCVGSAITLTPNPALTGNYLWQDGSTNNTFAANSMGLYWLQVSNNCGAARDSINIAIANPPAIFSLGADTTVCTGSTVLLSPIPEPIGSFAWQDGSTDSTYTANNQGNYWLSVTNNCGVASDTMLLTTVDYPLYPFNDLVVDTCTDAPVTLDAQNSGMAYIWSTNDTSAMITVSDTGLYRVTITNNGLCSITDSARVSYHSCSQCVANFPTAFTPNGDQINDKFRVIHNCDIDRYLLRIYNRWGEKVFETNNPKQGWDGTYKGSKQGMDTFVYFATIHFAGATNDVDLKGSVTVIR